ncbi:MAG: PLP-dependent transferase [Deltaproteobacteria bacterium]|nr:PLP-dependent transferase [Deltaproteobacteria bacterium]
MPKPKNKQSPGRHIDTRLVHGTERESWPDGATLPPVVYSSAFAYETAGEMEEVFSGRREGMVYSRLANPTVGDLEKRVTQACGARGAVAMSSGAAAIAMSLLALAKSGDELIASRLLFGGTYTLFTKTLADLGVKVHLVDPSDPAAAESLVGPATRAVFLEAIANPSMSVPDIHAWRKFCDSHGLALVLDATLLTPYLFNPEQVPADVAVFSASKYLAGAASVIGGLVLDTGRMDWVGNRRLSFAELRPEGEKAYLARLRKRLLFDCGASLSPMNAFLMMVGMESLGLRLERQCATSLEIARFLESRPQVRQVNYPGLPGSPSYELCRAQYALPGSLLSFRLADKAACFRFLDALELVQRVTNLGDTRTLALHPASTIYASFWKHEQEEAGVTEDLIRLSVGIEHSGDIISDLEQALNAI